MDKVLNRKLALAAWLFLVPGCGIVIDMLVQFIRRPQVPDGAIILPVLGLLFMFFFPAHLIWTRDPYARGFTRFGAILPILFCGVLFSLHGWILFSNLWTGHLYLSYSLLEWINVGLWLFWFTAFLWAFRLVNRDEVKALFQDETIVNAGFRWRWVGAIALGVLFWIAVIGGPIVRKTAITMNGFQIGPARMFSTWVPVSGNELTINFEWHSAYGASIPQIGFTGDWMRITPNKSKFGGVTAGGGCELPSGELVTRLETVMSFAPVRGKSVLQITFEKVKGKPESFVYDLELTPDMGSEVNLVIFDQATKDLKSDLKPTHQVLLPW